MTVTGFVDETPLQAATEAAFRARGDARAEARRIWEAETAAAQTDEAYWSAGDRHDAAVDAAEDVYEAARNAAAARLGVTPQPYRRKDPLPSGHRPA